MKTLEALQEELKQARAELIAAQDRDASQACIKGHFANVAQIRAEIEKLKAK